MSILRPSDRPYTFLPPQTMQQHRTIYPPLRADSCDTLPGVSDTPSSAAQDDLPDIASATSSFLAPSTYRYSTSARAAAPSSGSRQDQTPQSAGKLWTKNFPKKCITCEKVRSTPAATHQCRTCRRAASGKPERSSNIWRKCLTCDKIKSTTLPTYRCRTCRIAASTTLRRYKGKSTTKKCITCSREKSTTGPEYWCQTCRDTAAWAERFGCGGPSDASSVGEARTTPGAPVPVIIPSEGTE